MFIIFRLNKHADRDSDRLSLQPHSECFLLLLLKQSPWSSAVCRSSRPYDRQSIVPLLAQKASPIAVYYSNSIFLGRWPEFFIDPCGAMIFIHMSQ